jgi:hypothetical protein
LPNRSGRSRHPLAEGGKSLAVYEVVDIVVEVGCLESQAVAA